MKRLRLSKEEKELLASVERGEWKSVENLEREINAAQEAARNTLKQDRKVNLKLSAKDFEEFQTLATEAGVPYQILMSSVLHKYVSGRLVEWTREQQDTGAGS